jgi:hypothetical protein
VNDLLKMVKNKQVVFVRFQCNVLWYITECGFEFPVPVSDTGNGLFGSVEKATLLMRWIRKHRDHVMTAKQGAA